MIDFDDIKELPVSEEWIAAYMDGKLDAATSAFVESNLIDSPGHADFVESLKETWNMPGISMVDFGSSEISSSEASAIDNMNLPSINTNDLFNGFDVFNDLVFSDTTNLFLSISPYGDDFTQDNIAEWEVLEENNDIFSHGTDIFSDDNQSINIDTPDEMDGLPDDL